MSYTKVYESPYLKMVELTLKDLRQDGIISARVRPQNPYAIEVLEKEKNLAKKHILEYESITLALIGDTTNRRITAEDEKKFFEMINSEVAIGEKVNQKRAKLGLKDYLKLLTANGFYIIGSLFFAFGALDTRPLFFFVIILAPVLLMTYITSGITGRYRRILVPRPQISYEKLEKVAKFSLGLFWIIAIPLAYLMLSQSPLSLNSILTGEKESIRILLFNILGPIIYLGSVPHLFMAMVQIKQRQE